MLQNHTSKFQTLFASMRFLVVFFPSITMIYLMALLYNKDQADSLIHLMLFSQVVTILSAVLISSRCLQLQRKKEYYESAEKVALQRIAAMQADPAEDNTPISSKPDAPVEELQSPARWKHAYVALCKFHQQLLTHIVQDAAGQHFIGSLKVFQDEYVTTLRAYHSSPDNSKLLVEAERIAWSCWASSLKFQPGDHSTPELKQQWRSRFLPEAD